jgi:glucose-1-phosphate adenylyltransferase
VNSGIRTIGVATQYKPDALIAHLRSHWNGNAVHGGAAIQGWRAEERAARGGYRGTADAVYRNLGSIPHLEGSLVLVLGGDHVYQMDYRPMLEAHSKRKASVTIACAVAPIEEARHFGVMAAAKDGRIESFVEKPQTGVQIPQVSGGNVLVSTGIYVFDGPFLARILAIDADLHASGHDFGADILPRLIEAGRAYAYALPGTDGASAAYWRDIGTIGTFWRAHMDLLGPNPLLKVEDPGWPLGRAGAPPRVLPSTSTPQGGTIEESVVPNESTIAGDVSRCVLFDGVKVARGAKIWDSVVLPGAVVGAGSRLRGVIVDAAYRVLDGTVIERSGYTAEPAVLSEHYCETARYAVATR